MQRLTRQLEAKDEFIRAQRALIGHGRRMFDKASAAAGLGLWECDLPGEKVRWTGGTYDLFGVPRGSNIMRSEILTRYTEESLAVLNETRAKAIRERTGFELDAEIKINPGIHRWIRITATVEAEGDRAVRIFGIKRDVTDERRRWEAVRYLAEFDALTGLANWAQFQSKLLELCNIGSGALLLVDLDNFKQVNDTLGHAGGDECLKRVADRITSVSQGSSLVARTGGDEFALLLGPRAQAETARELAKRIVFAMQEPIMVEGRLFAVGASVGIAAVDHRGATEVYKAADAALYRAKAAGGSNVQHAQS